MKFQFESDFDDLEVTITLGNRSKPSNRKRVLVGVVLVVSAVFLVYWIASGDLSALKRLTDAGGHAGAKVIAAAADVAVAAMAASR